MLLGVPFLYLLGAIKYLGGVFDALLPDLLRLAGDLGILTRAAEDLILLGLGLL